MVTGLSFGAPTLFSIGHGRWIEVENTDSNKKSYRTYSAGMGYLTPSDAHVSLPLLDEMELRECLAVTQCL